MNPFPLDQDLESLRQSLHQIDDIKLEAVQKRRYWRDVAKRQDGEYSLTRLLDAMRSYSVEKHAPYELAESKRIAERVGRPPMPGYEFVPIGPRQYRDFTVAGQGASLVQAMVGPGDTFVYFLDIYFNFQRLGLTRLTVPKPANIPAASGNISTKWLTTEGDTASESQFDVITKASTPKTVSAYGEFSDKFLKQSPFGETIVLGTLARGVSAELSRKLLVGASPNAEPLGVMNTPGIGSLSAASANLPTSLNMVQTVENANALLQPTSAGFVMPPDVARNMRGRENASGSGMVMVGNTVAGAYPGIVTKGASPNSMVFGDWSQLALLEYNMLEISTDPYGVNSALFTKGIVGVRCLWTVDAIVLNAPSFCKVEGLS